MNGAMIHRPTFGQRLARRLGFRYVLAELPPEAEAMPGWMMTSVDVSLSLTDRLRLLVSGRLELDMRQATDALVDKCITATSFSIPAPWEGSRRAPPEPVKDRPREPLVEGQEEDALFPGEEFDVADKPPSFWLRLMTAVGVALSAGLVVSLVVLAFLSFAPDLWE